MVCLEYYVNKIIGFYLAFCMVFAYVVPGYAMEKEMLIYSETVIAKDNIFEVLGYLGIAPSNFIKTDIAGTGNTMEDLERAIEQIKRLPSKHQQISQSSC